MRTIAQAAWRVAAHGVYKKSLTCGIIHAMKISRKVVVAAAIAPFAVLAVHAAAFDTTVSNGFWCTWSYARETPAHRLIKGGGFQETAQFARSGAVADWSRSSGMSDHPLQIGMRVCMPAVISY